MTLAIDLFWSFRSPYSYLATPRLVRLHERYDLLQWRLEQRGLRART